MVVGIILSILFVCYFMDFVKWFYKADWVSRIVVIAMFIFLMFILSLGFWSYIRRSSTTNELTSTSSRRVWLDNIQNELKSKPYATFVEQPSTEVCAKGSHINIITQESHQNPVLGLGTKSTGYVCLDVDNLLEGFSNNFYENPYQAGDKFTLEQIKQMNTIVQDRDCFTPEQRQQFERYTMDYVLQSAHEDRDIQILSNSDNKEHLHALFGNLFYTGMYMRRWKGPGHPYPLLEKDTLASRSVLGIEIGESDDLQISTKITDMYTEYTQHLHNLRQQSEEMYDIYQNLPMIFMFNGNMNKDSRNISVAYHDTLTSGENCIRMASRNFISTGAYYMKVVCNEEFPGYRPGDAVEIIA